MMGNGVLSPEDIVSQARLILEPVPLANESLAAPSETRTRLCCPLMLMYPWECFAISVGSCACDVAPRIPPRPQLASEAGTSFRC